MVVALAPPSHGTTFSNLTKLGDLLSANALRDTILKLFGCEACIDLVPDGEAVKFLNDGKITQEGIKYTGESRKPRCSKIICSSVYYYSSIL